MRFLAATTDIPDPLINGVLAGDVVFLCGAGISRREGLGTFEQLTRSIYDHLGESLESEPAEKIAFGRQEFDRTLRALEKRLYRPGDSHSRVRQACAEVLKVPDGWSATPTGPSLPFLGTAMASLAS